MSVAGSQMSSSDDLLARVGRLQSELDLWRESAAAGGVGLYRFEPATQELVLTPTAARHLGLPYLETTVPRSSLQSQVASEDWDAVRTELGDRERVVFRVHSADGTKRWLEARGGQCGVLLEITEKQEAEERLSRSNADLQQFSYVASHDLQEPLRTITTYSQLLQRRYRDKLDQDANEFIEFIVSGSRRMDALVRDLLAYSRSMQSDNRPKTEVNMNGIVAWATLALQAELTESGGTITHDDLPTLPGHEYQLAQLVQQLFGNALKFRRPGVAPQIHVSATPADDHWTFAVRDNGIGIESQYIPRIFGAFKRLHGKDVPGTGIGLAICQNIVARHHGQLWAESVPGEGSTFYFTLSAQE